MLALGEDDLREQIKKCFQTDTPLPSALHDAAMQLYRQYLVVGGMPECVMQFAGTKDYILVRHTQDTILYRQNRYPSRRRCDEADNQPHDGKNCGKAA